MHRLVRRIEMQSWRVVSWCDNRLGAAEQRWDRGPYAAHRVSPTPPAIGVHLLGEMMRGLVSPAEQLCRAPAVIGKRHIRISIIPALMRTVPGERGLCRGTSRVRLPWGAERISLARHTR